MQWTVSIAKRDRAVGFVQTLYRPKELNENLFIDINVFRFQCNSNNMTYDF